MAAFILLDDLWIDDGVVLFVIVIISLSLRFVNLLNANAHFSHVVTLPFVQNQSTTKHDKNNQARIVNVLKRYAVVKHHLYSIVYKAFTARMRATMRVLP